MRSLSRIGNEIDSGNMKFKTENNDHQVINMSTSEKPHSPQELHNVESSQESDVAEIDDDVTAKDMSTHKHSIKGLVSLESHDNDIDSQVVKSQRSSVTFEEMSPSMVTSASPSPPLPSMSLVNSARASMMMSSKPMLQQSFTQTLMALSNNAMNRPSFFPMLDRLVLS